MPLILQVAFLEELLVHREDKLMVDPGMDDKDPLPSGVDDGFSPAAHGRCTAEVQIASGREAAPCPLPRPRALLTCCRHPAAGALPPAWQRWRGDAGPLHCAPGWKRQTLELRQARAVGTGSAQPCPVVWPTHASMA